MPAAGKAAAGNATAGKADHRPNQSPIRDQGHRGCCVAFASCAELEPLIARQGSPLILSTNHAYYFYMQEEQSTPCKDPGLNTFKAANYLQKHLICDESAWPYVSTDPTDLVAQGNCNAIDVPLSGITGQQGFGIQDYQLLPESKEVKPDGTIDMRDTLTLERLLDQGHDIVFGTIVAWTKTGAQGVIDVKLGPAGQPIFGAGGHAMVIVGYAKPAESDKPYFIVKNSWGTNYGHAGYLYLTYDYIRCYARYGYTTISLRQGKIQ